MVVFGRSSADLYNRFILREEYRALICTADLFWLLREKYYIRSRTRKDLIFRKKIFGFRVWKLDEEVGVHGRHMNSTKNYEIHSFNIHWCNDLFSSSVANVKCNEDLVACIAKRKRLRHSFPLLLKKIPKTSLSWANLNFEFPRRISLEIVITHSVGLEHVWITFSPMTKISQAKKL
jgi:hypothetical protein